MSAPTYRYVRVMVSDSDQRWLDEYEAAWSVKLADCADGDEREALGLRRDRADFLVAFIASGWIRYASVSPQADEVGS